MSSCMSLSSSSTTRTRHGIPTLSLSLSLIASEVDFWMLLSRTILALSTKLNDLAIASIFALVSVVSDVVGDSVGFGAGCWVVVSFAC